MRRREFILGSGALWGSGQLSLPPTQPTPGQPVTIREAIDHIIEATEAARLNETVDTVKAGDDSANLTGIATTFLPTCDVIERAREAGCNLLITHEPTFYNHLDQVDWLTSDSVYQHKRRLLGDSGMVVWRFHDYWHRVKPDPVTAALLEDLGLQVEEDREDNRIVGVPPTSLRLLATSFKEKLKLPLVRVVGEPGQICRRVGVLAGAWGGRAQINFLTREEVDALVCGEINEWETNIYIQDARSAGREVGLIILGHVNTEEPGMRVLVNWLQVRFPSVPVTHVPTGDPFLYL